MHPELTPFYNHWICLAIGDDRQKGKEIGMGTMKTFPTLAVLLLLLGGAPLMAGDPATQGSAREGTRVSAMAAALQASTVAVKSMDFNSDGSLTARGSIKMNS